MADYLVLKFQFYDSPIKSAKRKDQASFKEIVSIL